jgi:paraquat-inducible protein A
MVSAAPRPLAELRIVGCPNCGLLQRANASAHFDVILCHRCESRLDTGVSGGNGAALAYAAGTLLLLVPAIFEPFLTTSAMGATRTSTLVSAASFLWNEGWPLLGIVVLLFTIAFPILRFAALVAVLGTLHSHARPRWLAPAFRGVNALQTWAMLDVFLVASLIAYLRLQDSILVELKPGAVCLAGAALLSLLTRAALDRARVWQAISPGISPSEDPHARLCPDCELPMAAADAGSRCPRCCALIGRPRLSSALSSIALLVAAALLYLPANALPMATIPMDLTPTAYTVLGGIVDLAEAHYLGLAALVFCASFAIPLLKLAGMTWCNASVFNGSHRRLIAKTRVYRWLDEIGRWSMIDPFTIACTIPLVHYNSLIDGRADAAASPFAAVVILTTLSVKAFDPRLLWAAERLH